MSNATQLLHSIPVDPHTGAISVPIYQTSTFVQEAPGINKGYDYARSNNPTREAAEKIIAQLEQGTTAAAFSRQEKPTLLPYQSQSFHLQLIFSKLPSSAYFLKASVSSISSQSFHLQLTVSTLIALNILFQVQFSKPNPPY